MFDERDYERANRLAQGEIDAGVARCRESLAGGAGRTVCACGEPISEARRQAFGAMRCLECQARKEHEDRLRT